MGALLDAVIPSGLIGFSHSHVKPLPQKLQQFLGRAKSSLGAGINLLDPAFE